MGDDPPLRGPNHALVTIVQFADLTEGLAVVAAAKLDRVLAKHGAEVRVAFRHRPQSDKARQAARAAFAAHRQGKFWPMHDKLLGHSPRPGELEQAARALGLDLARFETDRSAADKTIDDDLAAAKRFGVDEPMFFVNGRALPTSGSAEALERLVEQELQRARTFVERRGNTRYQLYSDMISRFAPEVVQPQSGPATDAPRVIVSANDLPRLGPNGAPITLIECGDFDCPYCKRVEPTLEALRTANPDDLAIYWAHFPRDFHPHAKAAALAAAAAHRQAKFWPMHVQLLANQTMRSDEQLRELAKAAGLDLAAFETDRADPALATEVERQADLCAKHGAVGTPTFFLNGLRLDGAKSQDAFQSVIDAERRSAI